jgi:hypothetical protein
MYLHSLNARMLEASYGSLEASPAVLKARIVEKEAGSMTAELRHRLRYLQHLPVTCQFEVVELDLRPPLVSRDVLGYFQGISILLVLKYCQNGTNKLSCL